MKFESTLEKFVIFELQSYIGRKFCNCKPKIKDGANYLNLGCGYNIRDGYVNADFSFKVRFWKRDIRKVDWSLDLRYPLNCDDGVFNGLHCEHTFEHLTPLQVNKLLHELFRVLKNNSIIRITVPDIEKYIKFYNGKFDELNLVEFKKRFKTGCAAIRNVTQNFSHQSVWDFEEMKNALEEAGFKNVQKMSFNISNDEKLKIDLEERAWETLYVEAFKQV